MPGPNADDITGTKCTGHHAYSDSDGTGNHHHKVPKCLKFEVGNTFQVRDNVSFAAFSDLNILYFRSCLDLSLFKCHLPLKFAVEDEIYLHKIKFAGY